MTGRYPGEPAKVTEVINAGWPELELPYVKPELITEMASHKSDGKPLVNDLDPTFWLEMGEVLAQGLTKYPNDPDGKPNWWRGGSYRSFIASIQRHTMKLAGGEDLDEESGLPHAAHIAVDAMFVQSWLARSVGFDDRLYQSTEGLS